ncbi:MAG: hypothetical protein AB1816_13110 [Bacillota bacterium]
MFGPRKEAERLRDFWWWPQELEQEEEQERAGIAAALWSLGRLEGLGGPPARPEDDPVSSWWRG